MDTSETYKHLSDEASPLKPEYIIERVKWYEDPVYIKMCEKAKEIQALRDFSKELYIQVGDYFFGGNETLCMGSWGIEDVNGIWLPRQDQLQEMVMGKVDGIPTLMLWVVTDFAKFCMHQKITSMEQLWLAFVMSEKYNKTWDGKQWV